MANHNEKRELKIGDTFTNPSASSTLHTIRYDFRPATMQNNTAVMSVGSSNDVTITIPNADASSTVFKGSHKPYQKECVLIIDKTTNEITLERLLSNIQVKKTRSESAHKPNSYNVTLEDKARSKVDSKLNAINRKFKDNRHKNVVKTGKKPDKKCDRDESVAKSKGPPKEREREPTIHHEHKDKAISNAIEERLMRRLSSSSEDEQPNQSSNVRPSNKPSQSYTAVKPANQPRESSHQTKPNVALNVPKPTTSTSSSDASTSDDEDFVAVAKPTQQHSSNSSSSDSDDSKVNNVNNGKVVATPSATVAPKSAKSGGAKANEDLMNDDLYLSSSESSSDSD